MGATLGRSRETTTETHDDLTHDARADRHLPRQGDAQCHHDLPQDGDAGEPDVHAERDAPSGERVHRSAVSGQPEGVGSRSRGPCDPARNPLDSTSWGQHSVAPAPSERRTRHEDDEPTQEGRHREARERLGGSPRGQQERQRAVGDGVRDHHRDGQCVRFRYRTLPVAGWVLDGGAAHREAESGGGAPRPDVRQLVPVDARSDQVPAYRYRSRLPRIH